MADKNRNRTNWSDKARRITGGVTLAIVILIIILCVVLGKKDKAVEPQITVPPAPVETEVVVKEPEKTPEPITVEPTVPVIDEPIKDIVEEAEPVAEPEKQPVAETKAEPFKENPLIKPLKHNIQSVNNSNYTESVKDETMTAARNQFRQDRNLTTSLNFLNAQAAIQMAKYAHSKINYLS